MNAVFKEPAALLAIGVSALVALSLPLADVPLADGVGATLTGIVFAAGIAQIGTCACLAAMYRRSLRPSARVLAAVYLSCGIVGLALIGLDARSAGWLWTVWHVLFGFGTLAYAFAVARERRALERSRGTMTPALLAGAIGGAIIVALSLAGAARLPLVDNAQLTGYPAGPAESAALLACVAGLFGIVRLRSRGALEQALLLAVFAVTLDVATTALGGQRYVIIAYVGRVLYLLGSGCVLIGAVVHLVRGNEHAVELSERLGDEGRRTERHAVRLRSLWLTSAVPCGDEAFLRTVLDDASVALIEGRRFHVFLAHLSDGFMVVDAANDAFAGPDIEFAGARYALADSIMGIFRNEGATQAWPDIRDDARFDRSPRLQRLPWRAVIGTPFRVGQTLYCVCFAAPMPADREDFGVRDQAYVEIVASTCAARLQQRNQFERLRYQSEHDQLTGICNRAMFRSHGFEALRGAAPLAVVVADIDGFREVNHTLGHQTGDALLVEVAARLASLACANDVVARLGGDSFGFLLPGVENTGDAESRVNRFLEAFREPFSTGDRSGTERVALTASFGIAIAPADGRAFEELLARADAAVYQAKQAGRARWAFFDHRFEQTLTAAYKFKEELAAAFVRNEFELYFQPHVDLFDGRTAGAEALIRWNHPQRGLLAAGEFIPFAERHGLTERIGTWVMREAIRVSAPWRCADPEFCLWFNLSQSELHPAILRGRLAELEPDLRGLGIEITEGTAMSSSSDLAQAITMLRAAGFGIALDDFGTGYSSLAHLRRLPIDIVKIDRSFVAGLPHDLQDVAIVDAVLSIGKSYGFAVVAEGVETAEQVAYLATAGCTYAQGYFYARPMPASAFDGWLKAHTVIPSHDLGVRAAI